MCEIIVRRECNCFIYSFRLSRRDDEKDYNLKKVLEKKFWYYGNKDRDILITSNSTNPEFNERQSHVSDHHAISS